MVPVCIGPTNPGGQVLVGLCDSNLATDFDPNLQLVSFLVDLSLFLIGRGKAVSSTIDRCKAIISDP